MDDHVIQIPKIYAGFLLGEDALQLQVNYAAFRLVGLGLSLRDERVDLRVGEAATVGPLRRKAVRGVSIAVDVRIFIRADPAQGVDLEGTLGDVGVEGAKFVRAKLKINTNVAKLLLHDDGEQACRVIGGSLQSEMKPRAFAVGFVASSFQKSACARRVVTVGEDLVRCGTCPVAFGEHAVSKAGLVAEECVNDRGTVYGEGDSLTHTRVTQDRVQRVEVEVVEDGAGKRLHADVRILPHRVDGVERERIGNNVGGAFLYLQRSCDGVRDNFNADMRHMRWRAPVVVVAVEKNFFIDYLRDVAKWSRAYQRCIFTCALFHDTEEAIGEIEEQTRIGSPEMHGAGERARSFCSVHVGKASGLRSEDRTVVHALDRPCHIRSSEGRAVVEEDIGSDLKDKRKRIGLPPTLREKGLQVVVFVLAHERFEDQRTDVLRLGIGPHANVEVVRRAFDIDDDGAEVWPLLVATAEQ